MWFKNLFSSKQSDKKREDQKQTKINTQFETQQVLDDSSPLVDLTPDIRYQNIDLKYQNAKLPFPHNLIHQSQSILICKIQAEDGFQCRSSSNNFITCKFVCTDKQIVISPNIFLCSASNNKSINPNYFDLPLGEIQKLEIKQVKKQSLKLHIILKDNKQIIFTNKLGDSVKILYETISKFALVNGINKFFAFNYKKKYSQLAIQNIHKGWQIYNIRNEFIRQGAYKYFSLDQKKQKDLKYAYKIIKNHSFDISPTYPSQFVIPFNITNQQLIKSSKFRTRQRIPALTYFYQYKDECYASLFRCSQIKSGLMGNRCQQDQKIIKQISQSSNFISKTKKIYLKHNIKIYDARGFYAALGNMFAGKGYERQDFYNCDVQFLNIPNIHAVRDSYIKVRNADSRTEQLYEALTSSGWIQYLVLILAGAKQMSYDLMNGKNVLVHCSDGWDRTSQLSSLSQLLIDPYFRTIQGLAVLIQKDWRSFGHKFRQRTGQYHPTNYHPYEKSPVFIQFLDCIYQVLCQFPLSFEYNSNLLEYLAKHANSCIYGTFLTNSLKQAFQVKIQHQTIPIWTDIIYSQHRKQFTNPFYRQDLNMNNRFLNINLDIKNMKIWRQHLFNQVGEFQTALYTYEKQKLINKAQRQHLNANQKLIQQLKKQLSCFS